MKKNAKDNYIYQRLKIAPSHQLMAGDFSFGPVIMTCNLPEWQVEIIHSQNILLSRSFDNICCIVNVELHLDFNNLECFFFILQ